MTRRREQPLRAAPARPRLSLTEAAEATRRDRRTIRRYLDAGRLPGAEKVEGPTGPAWSIPVDDLLAAGLRLHAPGGPDDDQADDLEAEHLERAGDDDHAAEVAELRAELAAAVRRAEVAEARTELLEQIAAERADHLADLRRIVAPLEAAPEDRRRGWWRR